MPYKRLLHQYLLQNLMVQRVRNFIFTFMCNMNVSKTSCFSGYQFFWVLERTVCLTIFLNKKGNNIKATVWILSEK